MIRITRDIYNQLVDWTKVEKPNESSGYLFKDSSIFCKIITSDKSAGHFFDHNTVKLLELIEEYGKPTAIFHSHPCDAIPSCMDMQYMITTIPFFECIWLIMSNEMILRAWSLTEITLRLIELEVEII